MRRREFGCLAVGASTAAFLASPRLRAQSKPMPAIGWLYNGPAGSNAAYLDAFRQGLADSGYTEGQNVAIEYRWADDRTDRLPALAAELVERKVDVIVTIGTVASVQAARQASAAIPVVFGVGGDPVRLGIVSSLARPDGNVTGVSYLVAEIAGKRFDLLTQAVPRARVIGIVVNPNNTNIARNIPDTEEAARQRGLELVVARAASGSEIDQAFAALVSAGAGAVVIQADPFIHSRRQQLLALAARHTLPAIYTWREFAEQGGLMSYGPNLRVVYRQMGNYTGRILKGARPGDLPIVQPTAFEFVINLKTAKALGLAIPPAVLAGADELIE
jgi:putative tryptophan/tyrosine transport system substrate-binding protein